MQVFAILMLAAAAVQAVPVAGSPAPAPARGAQVTVRASATILRAETSSPALDAGALARQVRPQVGGQVLVEFY